MNCSEVKSILGLGDEDARLDPEAIRSHLGSCATCAERWPEVGLLVGAATAPRLARAPRRRARKAIAAALVALVVVAVALDRGTRGRKPPANDVAQAAPEVLARPVASTVSRETVTFDRGQRYESRITYELWTAPTPSCLQPGASGS